VVFRATQQPLCVERTIPITVTCSTASRCSRMELRIILNSTNGGWVHRIIADLKQSLHNRQVLPLHHATKQCQNICCAPRASPHTYCCTENRSGWPPIPTTIASTEKLMNIHKIATPASVATDNFDAPSTLHSHEGFARVNCWLLGLERVILPKGCRSSFLRFCSVD
jgi:hypothetical protein